MNVQLLSIQFLVLGNQDESLASFVLYVVSLTFSFPLLVHRIRNITARVACAIVKEAVKEDNAEGHLHTDVKELRRLVEDDVRFCFDITCIYSCSA